MFSNTRISHRSFLALACVALSAALAPDRGLAAEKPLVSIRQVQVSDGDRVDLLLDRRLDPSQIRTDFINDIIQFSISDASVYPAKISSVSGTNLSKVFVYQYAPRLVRVRLTVSGRAESYQGRVQAIPSGKMLGIRLGSDSVTDKVASKSAQAQKQPSPAAASSAGADAEERALLEKVLAHPVAKAPEKTAEDQPAAAAASKTAKESDTEGGRNARRRDSRPGALAGRKDGFSPLRMLASLMGVVLLLGAALFGLKKFAASRSRNGAVGRWVRKSLGRAERVIEVVATHHLGPKKSIHMVKVAGRTLVLGVADDSINLITELPGDAVPRAAASSTDEAGGGEDFLSALGEQIAQESGRPATPTTGAGATSAGPALFANPAPAPRTSGARDRIRSRLEGMKQL